MKLVFAAQPQHINFVILPSDFGIPDLSPEGLRIQSPWISSSQVCHDFAPLLCVTDAAGETHTLLFGLTPARFVAQHSELSSAPQGDT